MPLNDFKKTMDLLKAKSVFYWVVPHPFAYVCVYLSTIKLQDLKLIKVSENWKHSYIINIPGRFICKYMKEEINAYENNFMNMCFLQDAIKRTKRQNHKVFLYTVNPLLFILSFQRFELVHTLLD